MLHVAMCAFTQRGVGIHQNRSSDHAGAYMGHDAYRDAFLRHAVHALHLDKETQEPSTQEPLRALESLH